ncbi:MULTISPECIES: MMPL family transporter [Nocardia]|uniref:MMPL family transporter n=1 Tax=Nocardia TaxID=1817 RepID=UPI0004C424B3|nr:MULTISPECIES: MMPL family transporter [Nocardia]MBF6147462.1 MMPL family transporter [Nocardia nova]MDN2496491.1 MMPL family transporter [Nocardia nova]
MLSTVAAFATRHARAVLAACLLVGIVSIAFGATAPTHLKTGGFSPPDTESARVSSFLGDEFPSAAPNVVLLVRAPGGVESAAARTAGERVVAQLHADHHVDAVQSYWQLAPDLRSALRSGDGREALVLAHVAGDDTTAPQRAGALVDRIGGDYDGVTVLAGGQAVALNQMSEQVVKDLIVTEAIAVPLTGLALIIVFGSVIAAAIPLAVGLFTIAVTLPLLRILAEFGDVSIFALNMMSALGFAVAIDSSLFLVSRFREERAAGLDTGAAVVRTARTAGRTVLFSGAVVGLSLCTLLVFPLYFLRSLAFAGLSVLAAAVVTTLLLVPAALAVTAPHLHRFDLRVPLRRWAHRPAPSGVPAQPADTRWYRVVRAVMRRPVLSAVAVVALLLVLGTPALSMRFGSADDRVLHGASSHEVGDALRGDFRENAMAAVTVALPGYGLVSPELEHYAANLSRVEGVTSVLSASGVFAEGTRVAAAPDGMSTPAGTYLRVGTEADPSSPAGNDLLHRIRDVPPPSPALYGGAAAENADSVHALTSRLPLALGLIAVSTLLVLLAFTGSVWLPVKALLLNTLSLSATFGAMVWIFQEGHLSAIFGFTPTGFLVPTMPILMFCLAFGVSMDYEVFLLSRIREEWIVTGDNTRSVAIGVARTARIFTAAALLMTIAFAGMVTSRVSFIQLFGLGLALAVLSDATLIRGILVPALMRLLGAANWWGPAWLRRLPAGLEGGPDPDSRARPGPDPVPVQN